MLVPELLNEGYKITVLDNFMFKQASLNNLCTIKNFSIINGDIRDKNLMKKFMQTI